VSDWTPRHRLAALSPGLDRAGRGPLRERAPAGEHQGHAGRARDRRGAADLRSIDKLAEFLKKNPNRNLLIEGHTDNTGNEDFNLKLSQQRADAVRDQLVSRGIAPERITTKGYGPKYPAVDNDSSAGRQQNRRVEVLVLNEGVSAESAARSEPIEAEARSVAPRASADLLRYFSLIRNMSRRFFE